MIQGEEIRLDGDAHGGRGLRELTQYRLAADDHDVRIVGDDGGGTDQVLELFPGHGCRSRRSRVSRQRIQRSWGFRAPANGLDWRSASASSLRSVRNWVIEGRSPARISAHLRA